MSPPPHISTDQDEQPCRFAEQRQQCALTFCHEPCHDLADQHHDHQHRQDFEQARDVTQRHVRFEIFAAHFFFTRAQVALTKRRGAARRATLRRIATQSAALGTLHLVSH